MDLQERFAPLMAAALHYAGSPQGLAMPLEDVQAQLLEQADEERAMPMPSAGSGLPDMPEERRRELEDARFAVYAWADEKLLNAQRPDAAAWMPLSLQCHYFSTTEAGQTFFSKLDALLTALGITSEEAEPPDLAQRLEQARSLPSEGSGLAVLRIYALCLLYGFRGRLYSQDDLLARVRKACRALLRRQDPAQAPKATPVRQDKQTLLYHLEPLAYVLVPVAVCALFWLFCANILAHIPVKGF
ncbi:MAG: DotU family type IV/VI secretion system protein [Desulfovibrio sp.]|nr:DotU family type IV/VI secretion system protein [Desulfovibrio sp.]